MLANEISLEKTLRKLRVFFVFTGLNVSDLIKPNRMLYLFNMAWSNTDLLGSLYFFLTGIINGVNVIEVLFMAPCVSYSSVVTIKGIMFMIQDDNVHRLIHGLIKLEKISSNDLETLKENLADVRLLHKMTKAFKVLTGLTIFVFNVSPLLLTALTYFKTGEIKLFLPFLDIYPFDALDIKYWPFAYTHQIWSVIVIIIYGSAVDSILFVCCMYLRIHFRVLQKDIKNLISDELLFRGQFRGDIDFHCYFKELLNRHQEIIWLSRILEIIYTKLVLLNFMVSSIVICLTGFNIMIAKDITLLVTFLTFLMMSLLQIWCLCYFGELLMSSSLEVSDAVYECRWYLATKDISKQLLFLQTRAQKPCKLTASGFADVNLNSFMKILSRAWSYFALLNTIYAR